MKISENWKDYSIIATGDGYKLERWKDVYLLRPDPQVIWSAQTDLFAYPKLNAYYKINNQKPTVQSATKAIKDIQNDAQPVPVTIDKILNEVARTYGTTVENITSEKRNSNIAKARQAAMFIVREITGLSEEAAVDLLEKAGWVIRDALRLWKEEL